MIGIYFILLVIVVILLDIYLYVRRVSITERIIEKVKQTTPKEKTVIIHPPSPNQEALEDIFERNNELNLDTKLNDIL